MFCLWIIFTQCPEPKFVDNWFSKYYLFEMGKEEEKEKERERKIEEK